jgi:hypothetical protein
MGNLKTILVCACIVGFAQPIWSQKGNEAAKPSILGYLDPKTGAFRPVIQNSVQSEDAEIAAALTPTTGTLVFSFTITIKSANLVTPTILCTATASPIGDTSGISISESGTVKATITGSTAKCTVNMAYSWPLANPTTDNVFLNYDINAEQGTATSESRLSTQSLPTIKVPVSGTTTTKTITATI